MTHNISAIGGVCSVSTYETWRLFVLPELVFLLFSAFFKAELEHRSTILKAFAEGRRNKGPKGDNRQLDSTQQQYTAQSGNWTRETSGYTLDAKKQYLNTHWK